MTDSSSRSCPPPRGRPVPRGLGPPRGFTPPSNLTTGSRSDALGPGSTPLLEVSDHPGRPRCCQSDDSVVALAQPHQPVPVLGLEQLRVELLGDHQVLRHGPACLARHLADRWGIEALSTFCLAMREGPERGGVFDGEAGSSEPKVLRACRGCRDLWPAGVPSTPLPNMLCEGTISGCFRDSCGSPRPDGVQSSQMEVPLSLGRASALSCFPVSLPPPPRSGNAGQ